MKNVGLFARESPGHETGKTKQADGTNRYRHMGWISVPCPSWRAPFPSCTVLRQIPPEKRRICDKISGNCYIHLQSNLTLSRGIYVQRQCCLSVSLQLKTVFKTEEHTKPTAAELYTIDDVYSTETLNSISFCLFSPCLLLVLRSRLLRKELAL